MSSRHFKIYKFVISFTLIFGVLLSTTVNPARAGEQYAPIDERFPSDTSAVDENDYSGISINGTYLDSIDQPSWISCKNPNSVLNFEPMSQSAIKSCSDNAFYRFHSILPVCDSSNHQNCLSQMYSKTSEKIISANFQKYSNLESKNQFRTKIGNTWLTGGLPSIWKFDSENTELQGDFLLIVSIDGDFSISENKFSNIRFSAEIYRVFQVFDESFTDPTLVQIHNQSGVYERKWKYNPNRGYFPVPSCALLVRNYCYMKDKLPIGERLGVTIRTSLPLSGWFHGRLAEGKIEVSENPTSFEYSFEGIPTRVPLILGYSKVSDSPTHKSRGVLLPEPGSDSAMQFLSAWLPVIHDTSQALPTIWSIKSLGENSSICMNSDKLILGIVSTNSATYSPGSPIWDSVERNLLYKLVSPHFSPDGSIFKGSYNLQIHSDVARCLYGFSNAPVKAAIQIGYDDGKASVATTTISENRNWIRLDANGFEFSSPVIKVSFDQSMVNDSQSNAGDGNLVKPLKLKVVYCQRGTKIIKKTGISPKCPAGYKKRVS